METIEQKLSAASIDTVNEFYDTVKKSWLANPHTAAQGVLEILAELAPNFTEWQQHHYARMLDSLAALDSGTHTEDTIHIKKRDHLNSAHQDILAIWIPAYVMMNSWYWGPGYLHSGFGISRDRLAQIAQ